MNRKLIVAVAIGVVIVTLTSVRATDRFRAAGSVPATGAIRQSGASPAISAVSGYSNDETGDSSIDESISASNEVDGLTVHLRIDPADQGVAHFTATISRDGKEVAVAPVRIRLEALDPPHLGVSQVPLAASRGIFAGSGRIAQEGLWRADVRVGRGTDPSGSASVPFVFIAGPEAAFLNAPVVDPRFGSAEASSTGDPGAAATVRVHLRPHLRVRYVVTMPGMIPDLEALTETGRGWYSGLLIPEMEGYMNLAVQVGVQGTWRQARMLVFEVDGNVQVHVLA